MKLEQKVKLLQTVYASALVDFMLRMEREGVIENVTSEKKEEQMLNGKLHAVQFGIEKPEDVFIKLADLFGCANWVVKSDSEGFSAEATSCMLCVMAKKMGAQSPCNIFCLDPMKGMIEGIDPDLSYDVKETLWASQKCKIKIQKK